MGWKQLEVWGLLSSKTRQRLHAGQCPVCSANIVLHEFKDELSKKEYEISGLCQGCQDKVFAPVEEYEYDEAEEVLIDEWEYNKWLEWMETQSRDEGPEDVENGLCYKN